MENRQRQKGFTVIELMISLVITALVLVSVYTAFITQFRSYTTQDNVSTVQADVRSVGEIITRDIRNAGFGLPAGNNPIAVAVNGGAGPDSITVNLASSMATYLTSPAMAGGVITVQSAAGFEVGQLVNIVDIRTKSVLLTGNITAVNVVGNTLTVTGAPTGNLMNGDVVVSPPWGATTYNLAGTTLTRNGVVLSRNIQSFKLNYIMSDGTTVTVPADYSQVSAVQVALTGVTNLQVSTVNGAGRARSIQTVVSIRNRGF
jgi:prepilin-type N-terminal cleavage/methylation domain-containing protein